MDVSPLQTALQVLGSVANAGPVDLCGPCTDLFSKWWHEAVVAF
jgi:hypothetical protein